MPAFALLAVSAYAEAPNLFTYQGRLKEGGQAVSGNRAIEIFVCNAESGPTCYTSGSQPVAVSNGLFRSTFSIPSAANFGAGDWWLEIKVGADTLTPRERLTSNAYSLFSATAAYAENISAAAGSDGVYISSNLYVTGGKYYGDGSQLQNLPVSGGAVAKAGDAMTGQLTLYGSTLTVGGNAFSVGGGAFKIESGKIGIGTIAPSGILEINGTDNPQLLLTDLSGDVTLGMRYSNGAPRHVLGVPYYNDRVVLTNRNAPFPSQPDSAILLWDSGVTSLQMGTGGYLSFLAGTATEKARFTPQGNFGIGSTAPLYRLVVSSAAGEAGNMLVISTGTSDVIRLTGAGEIYANYYHGDGSQLNGVVATGIADNAVTTAKIADANVTDGKIAGLSASKLTGALPAISGALLTDLPVSVGAVAKAGDTMTGQLTLSGSTLTVAGNAFSVGGSTLAVSYGRVGIGTNTPGYPLSLNPPGSNIATQIGLYQNGALGATISGGTSAPGISLVTGADVGTGAVWTHRDANSHGRAAIYLDDFIYYYSPAGTVGDAITWQEQFRIDGPTGRVGIGAPAPAYPLDVAGDINSSTGFCINGDCKGSWSSLADNLGNHTATQNLDLNTFNLIGVGSVTISAGLTAYSSVTVAGNAFSVSGATFSVVAGKVGVGIAVPTNRLHAVDGGDGSGASDILRLSHRGFLPGDDAYLVFNPASGMMTAGAKIGGLATGNYDAELAFITSDNQANTEKMRITDNGRIGIGTTLPSAVLHVSSASATPATALPIFKVSSGTASSQQRFVVTHYGVGIATGAPQAALDVVAAGSTASDYAQIWRNSGGTIVASMTATGQLRAINLDVGEGSADQVVLNARRNGSATIQVDNDGSLGEPKLRLASNGTEKGAIAWLPGSTEVRLAAGTGQILTVHSNNSETMRLDESNNMAIGRTGTAARLDVQASGSTVNDYAQIWRNSGGTIVSSLTATGLMNVSSIVVAGNIGIGIGNPTAKLEVAGDVKIVDGTQGAGKVLTSDASGAASWQAVSGVPSGAVMFFNLAGCPAGWTEMTTARGRYLVGLPSGGALAGTSGSALSDLENRAVGQHSHSVTDVGHVHSITPHGSSGGGNMGTIADVGTSPAVNSGNTASGVSVNSFGDVAGTNAPYVQLLICQKD